MDFLQVGHLMDFIFEDYLPLGYNQDPTEFPNGSFPMSLSWHSHLTEILQRDPELPGPSTCIQVGPDGHIIAVDPEAEERKISKPKRSKSITAMNSHELRINSDALLRNNQGFRTPQSLSGYKCNQTIDPRFWRLPRVCFSPNLALSRL